MGDGSFARVEHATEEGVAWGVVGRKREADVGEVYMVEFAARWRGVAAYGGGPVVGFGRMMWPGGSCGNVCGAKGGHWF